MGKIGVMSYYTALWLHNWWWKYSCGMLRVVSRQGNIFDLSLCNWDTHLPSGGRNGVTCCHERITPKWCPQVAHNDASTLSIIAQKIENGIHECVANLRGKGALAPAWKLTQWVSGKFDLYPTDIVGDLDQLATQWFWVIPGLLVI